MDMKPLVPSEITIDTSVGSFAAKVWGPDDGEPVLGLHGWLDNAASFDFLGPLLAGVRLAALDLAGHGFSDHRPSGASYFLIDHVRDVMAVTERMGWERFTLLGHSLGAAIASIIAGAFPRHIARLALVEGVGPLPAESEGFADKLAQFIQEQLNNTRRRKSVYRSVDEAARKRQSVGGLSFSAARALVERNLMPHGEGFAWRSDQRLRSLSPQRLSEAQVRDCLRRIQSPSLLILADAGLESRYPFMRERADLIGDLRLVRLAGGHHLHMDQAPAVAKVLNRFFRDAKPIRTACR